MAGFIALNVGVFKLSLGKRYLTSAKLRIFFDIVPIPQHFCAFGATGEKMHFWCQMAFCLTMAVFGWRYVVAY